MKTSVNRWFVGTALVLSIGSLPGLASAKGCLKGAVVGGVGGHVAGHGVLGAAAGCAVGHHMAAKKDKAAAAQAAHAGAAQPGTAPQQPPAAPKP